MNYLSYIDKNVYIKTYGSGLSMSRPSRRVAPSDLTNVSNRRSYSYGIHSILQYPNKMQIVLYYYNRLNQYRDNISRFSIIIINDSYIDELDELYEILIRKTNIYKHFNNLFTTILLKLNKINIYNYSSLIKLINKYKNQLLKTNNLHNIYFYNDINFKHDYKEVHITNYLFDITMIKNDNHLIIELCLVIIFIHLRTYNIFASFKISNRLNRDTYLLDDTNPDNLPNTYDNIISMLFYLYEIQKNIYQDINIPDDINPIEYPDILSGVFTDLYIASIIIQKYGSDAHKELFAKIIKNAFERLMINRRRTLRNSRNALLEKVIRPPELII